MAWSQCYNVKMDWDKKLCICCMKMRWTNKDALLRRPAVE